MRRKIAYVVLLAVLISFSIREAGVIYGKRFNRPLFPEWLQSFAEKIDRAVLFFSDRGGPIYSAINYAVILLAIFAVAVLRSTGKRRLSPQIRDLPTDKIVGAGENPFAVGIPEWGEDGVAVDIYALMTEGKYQGHGVRSKARDSGSDKGRDDDTRPPHDNGDVPRWSTRKTLMLAIVGVLFLCAVVGAIILSLNSGSAPAPENVGPHISPSVVGVIF